jgi:hypothetical protein
LFLLDPSCKEETYTKACEQVRSVQSLLAKYVLARVADLIDGVQHWVHNRWELHVLTKEGNELIRALLLF